MKTAILLLLLISLTTSISAQTTAEALQFNRNFLVHSAGLPEELLLFSPDTASRILFNPARANFFGGNFIYVNYFSDYYIGQSYRQGNFPSLYSENYSTTKNPSFSLAALFGSGDVKWMLEFSNGINRFKDNRNTAEEYNRVYVPDQYYDKSFSSSDDMLMSEGSNTSLKLSRIFTMGSTKVSVGVFGILFSNGSSGGGRYLYYDNYKREGTGTDSTRIYRHTIDEQINHFDGKDKNFAVGLEFTASGSGWDFIGSIDYQLHENSLTRNIYDNNSISDSSYYGTTYSSVSNDVTSTSLRNNVDQKPSYINLNSYFRHNTDWIFPDDNVFLSLKVFFSSGNISSQSVYDYRTIHSYENNPWYGDTTINTSSDEFDSESWGLRVSTGYVISKALSDLSILTGIRLSGSLGKLKYVDETSYYPGYLLETNSSEPQAASITIPVYAGYTPTEWVTIFGGLNYSYEYRNIRTISGRDGISISPGSDIKLFQNSRLNFFNNGWRTYKTIYFGGELRHHSGLRAQFLFDRDIMNVPDWNVSLGWVF